jgi:hypothetical protein
MPTILKPDSRSWQEWLEATFPRAVAAPFAPRHLRAWAWLDALRIGVRPRALVEIWARGGGKSSTIELGCVWLARQQRRRFGLYVCKTQDAANRHVQSIAALFEQCDIGRALNAYGHSRGWTRQMLRTASGFNLLAVGLDVGVRGAKLDELRPDLIVLDDIDDRHDTPATVAKKRETITESILPAGSADHAVIFIQNRIHDGSLAAELADNRADWLLDRLFVQQEPAVYDLELAHEQQPDGTWHYRVTGGVPTWAGQDLVTVEQQINTWGRRAFLREAQHDTRAAENGLWQRERDIVPHRVSPVTLPPLIRIVVGLDPSGTATGDAAGIIVAGLDARGHVYVLADVSMQGSPRQWAAATVSACHQHEADSIVAEQNNGGEMVEVTLSTVRDCPQVRLVHASRGKVTRAEPVQKLYEEGRVHHVGVFDALEDELCRWQPGDDSPNRLDALVWAITDLVLLRRAADIPALPPATPSRWRHL